MLHKAKKAYYAPCSLVSHHYITHIRTLFTRRQAVAIAT